MKKTIKKQIKKTNGPVAYERMIMEYIHGKPYRKSKFEIIVYDESAKIGNRRLIR